MKYRTKSAEVLNEADRFQRMLDWELFTSNQDIQLNHSYIDGVTWRPGDFLYDHPRLETCDHDDCGDCIELRARYGGAMEREEDDDDYSGAVGNCIRPMIQEYELESGLQEAMRRIPHEDLEDEFYLEGGHVYFEPTCCDVAWDRHTETTCWMCGKEYPLLERQLKFGKSYLEMQRSGYFTPNQVRQSLGFISSIQEDENGVVVSMRLETWAAEAFQNMRESVERMGEGFRRLYVNMPRRNGFTQMQQYFDEYIAFDVDLVQPFYADSYSYHNPFIEPVNPFQRPNVRGPCWGTAVLYDPNDEPLWPAEVNRMYGLVPTNWADPAPIPLPQLPEPVDYSDWTPGERTGPPTTPNWRNR